MRDDFLAVETLVILLLLVVSIVAIVARRIRVPYTVALVLVGLFLAMLELTRNPAASKGQLSHWLGSGSAHVDRGGDITYHGPGQLVGYPVVTVDNRIGAVDHVCAVEGVVIDALTELGLPAAGRLPGFAGVWLDVDDPDPAVVPRKICAIGVRLANGRELSALDIQWEYLERVMRYSRTAGFPPTN